MERFQKREYLEHVSGYQIEGSIDQAITYLQSLKTGHPNKEVKLEWFSGYNDASGHFELVYYRPETDEEYNLRQNSLANIRENRRQQYLALKAEFEGESQ